MTVFGNRNRQRQRAEKVRVERYEGFWLVEFFGILRCAQDDGKNRQRQEQPQVLRLRCSQNAVSNFAQDDNFFLSFGRRRTGNGKGAEEFGLKGVWMVLAR
jgi:hypothetical protein